MENERELFIKEREERYNGSITFFSFAKLLGYSKEESPKNLSGLIYIINNIVYFEDFKPRPSPLLMNSEKEYIKYECQISVDQIISVTNVKESEAYSCVRGTFNQELISPLIGRLKTLFFKSVTMINTADNHSIFFDITDYKTFLV